MKEIDTKPIDFTILTYLLTYQPDDYHAVSSISKTIGAHPKTVRSAFIRMEKRNLIRRIYRKGEANMYDISGWVSKIQAYAISNHTPTQKSIVVPTQSLPRDPSQKLGTNKYKDEEKETMPGFNGFKQKRTKYGI